MTQGFDGVEAGGAAGGEVAEDDADYAREGEGEDDNNGVDDERHLEQRHATQRLRDIEDLAMIAFLEATISGINYSLRSSSTRHHLQQSLAGLIRRRQL